MDQTTLTASLRLVGEILGEQKAAPAWLVVCGGTALLIQGFGNRPTKDVDVMALREWEGNVVSAFPLPDAVTKAAVKVAGEFGLPSNWLNSAASLHGIDFSLFPRWFWQDLDTREYGSHLKISFIGRRGLILLKLSAVLDRDQRRDIEDIISLKPTSTELEESLRWVLANLLETTTHPKIPALLEELGHAELIPGFR